MLFRSRRALMAQPEWKTDNTNVLGGVIGVPGGLNPLINVPLFGVGQGTSENERIGSRVRLRSFQWKASIRKSPATARPYQEVRFIIVVYTEAQSVYALQDVLEDTANAAEALISTYAQFNTGFRILVDRRVKLQTSLSEVASPSIFRRMNMVQRYDGVAPADFLSNVVRLFVFSDDDINPPVIDFTTVVRYQDN